MTVCTSCGTPAPDDMRHCSQCGARLPEPELEAPGNTSHFGDQDLKNLMSRMDREEDEAELGGNLLAGLPRPKAASMLSPLRGGQTAPSARKPEKRARSASGSTVMGMPLFNTGEQRAMPLPRPRAPTAAEPAPDMGAPIADGSSIQSLGSFQDDFGDAAEGPVEPPSSSAPPRPASAPPADAATLDAGVSRPSSAPPAGREAPAPSPAKVREPSTPASPPPASDDAPRLPRSPDVTSPERPTEQAPAVSSSNTVTTAVIVVVVAAVLAGLAFVLLR